MVYRYPIPVTRDVLRSLRLRRGLSQAEVAEKLGVTRGYITQIENGVRPLPRYRKLLELLEVYRITAKYFDELINKADEQMQKKLSKTKKENLDFGDDIDEHGLTNDSCTISESDFKEYLVKRYGVKILYQIRKTILDYIKFTAGYENSFDRVSSGIERDFFGQLQVFHKLSQIELISRKKDIRFKRKKTLKLNVQLLVYFLAKILVPNKKTSWKDVSEVLTYYYKSEKLKSLSRAIPSKDLIHPANYIEQKRYVYLEAMNKAAIKTLQELGYKSPKSFQALSKTNKNS
jgi:transcriptional regulator with XRE-family HTH domain